MPHTPDGGPPHAENAREADSASRARDQVTLARLRGELWLIHYVLRVERERVAQLADEWGHDAFADFLRERKVREDLPFTLPE